MCFRHYNIRHQRSSLAAWYLHTASDERCSFLTPWTLTLASRVGTCVGTVEPFKHLLRETTHPQVLVMGTCSGQHSNWKPQQTTRTRWAYWQKDGLLLQWVNIQQLNNLTQPTSCLSAFPTSRTNSGLTEVLLGYIPGQIGSHQDRHVNVQHLVNDIWDKLNATFRRVNALCKVMMVWKLASINGFYPLLMNYTHAYMFHPKQYYCKSFN